jgi:Family of unknown function (DUF5631)/Family of unknown function (DUF5632)
MTGFPRGDWSLPLVGDQWPYDEDLMALLHGKLNRGKIKTGYMHFADMLRNAQTGPLADQQGYTADDLRNAFRQGEEQAHQVAEKNGTKESAYESAYDSMVSLQHDLTNLANEYNQQIKDIENSKEPTEAKVAQIVFAINQGRTLATMAAAKWSGNVFDAMQRVLDAEGPGGQSARQFAQAHGLDASQMFRHADDQNSLTDQVRGVLTKGSTNGLTGNSATTPTTPLPASGPQPPSSTSNLTQNIGGGSYHQPNSPGGPKPTVKTAGLTSNLGGATPPTPPPAPAPTATPTPSAPTSGLSHAGTSMGAPSLSAPSSGIGAPTSPSVGGPSMAGGTPQPTTPGELMHSFDKGLQAGTPLPGAGAMQPPQVAPTDPQLAQPTAASASVGVPATAQAYESSTPVTHTSVTEAAPAPQMMAGPAASVGPAAPAPSGSLPAYASDIRPAVPAATMPAAPPSLPPSMTPGSAPVHPSAGQGSASTPAMVRQAPPPPPPSSPSALGTESVVATATGAAAGAASANATARARLQRLVAAVARQQPRLAWAAGDRPDETTVLATDLASGWIPPGIELPAAITLLHPERRRGDLETLLGEVSVAAGYSPIHHISEEDEPIPTSPRPRHVPEIDELGWELSQATQWRDGLPRLAHTLAKAASGGTGVLDKEVDLLDQHLAAVSSRVLDSYPENVDPHNVGNWQLLAAIAALVAGDKSAATYHLAWFQACSTTAGQTQS